MSHSAETNPASVSPHAGAPRSGGRALLITAALAVALSAADTYVVVLALEEMMAGVGLGIDQLQRATPIVSGFLLGYIAVLPLIGRLSDLVSRQRVLLWCLVLFLLGSVVTALATELPVIVGGRVVQGIGGGGLVPATLALVADLLPRGRRGAALGLVSAVQEVGSVLGPLLGAAILAVWDWRAIFWVNALAAFVLALMVGMLGRNAPVRADAAPGDSASNVRGARWPVWAWRVGVLAGALGFALLLLALWAPETLTSNVTYGPPFVPYRGHTAKLATPIGLWALGLLIGFVVLSAPRWIPRAQAVDMLGATLIAGGLGCLVWAFAGADPSRQVVGDSWVYLVPVAIICFIGYLVRHRFARQPLIERGTVSGRVPSALVVSFLVGTALVAVVIEIPVLARLTVTNSQTVAAFVLLRFLIAVPAGALLGGVALRRWGPGWVAGLGLALAAGAMALMGTWHADALTSWITSTPVLVAAGLGVGLAIAPVNDVALADAPDDAHGIASALVVVARMTGMVLGLALLTAVGLHRLSTYLQSIANPGRDDVTAAGVLQAHTVLVGAALSAAAAALISVVFLGRQREGRSPVHQAD